MNVNKQFIGGRFCRDHDLAYLPNGMAVLKNSVAVSEKYKSKSGEDRESTAFFDVIAWGKNAENLNNYTIKGSPIWIEAKMKNESWEDKATGKRRSKCVFTVQNFQFIETAAEQARRAERSGVAPAQGQVPATGAQVDANGNTQEARAMFADVEDDDEIPF